MHPTKSARQRRVCSNLLPGCVPQFRGHNSFSRQDSEHYSEFTRECPCQFWLPLALTRWPYQRSFRSTLLTAQSGVGTVHRGIQRILACEDEQRTKVIHTQSLIRHRYRHKYPRHYHCQWPALLCHYRCSRLPEFVPSTDLSHYLFLLLSTPLL